MGEVFNYIAVFIFGAGGLALINVIQKRWEMKYERRAAVEDRKQMKEDKLDDISKKLAEVSEKQERLEKEMKKNQDEVEKTLLNQNEALKLDMLYKIFEAARYYISKGEITIDDRRRLHEMHECYHNGLGGNGDADLIMQQIDGLQVKT